MICQFAGKSRYYGKNEKDNFDKLFQHAINLPKAQPQLEFILCLKASSNCLALNLANARNYLKKFLNCLMASRDSIDTIIEPFWSRLTQENLIKRKFSEAFKTK